jgi:hypothetical protein
MAGNRCFSHASSLTEICSKAVYFIFERRGRSRIPFRKKTTLAQESFQGTNYPTGVLLLGPVVVVGSLEVLLSHLIQRSDAVASKPADQCGDCFEVVANGSQGVALIGKPLHEIIQEWTEYRQGSPTGEGTGTYLNKERFFFHAGR